MKLDNRWSKGLLFLVFGAISFELRAEETLLDTERSSVVASSENFEARQKDSVPTASDEKEASVPSVSDKNQEDREEEASTVEENENTQPSIDQELALLAPSANPVKWTPGRVGDQIFSQFTVTGDQVVRGNIALRIQAAYQDGYQVKVALSNAEMLIPVEGEDNQVLAFGEALSTSIYVPKIVVYVGEDDVLEVDETYLEAIKITAEQLNEAGFGGAKDESIAILEQLNDDLKTVVRYATLSLKTHAKEYQNSTDWSNTKHVARWVFAVDNVTGEIRVVKHRPLYSVVAIETKSGKLFELRPTSKK